MARPAAWRQEWRTVGRRKALQCSKFMALVLSLFSHYVLFDQKPQATGALSGRVGHGFGGSMRAIKSKAKVLAASLNIDGMRLATHRGVVAD
jgi:hypothetical protein